MNRESDFGMSADRIKRQVCGNCWWHKPTLQRDGSSDFECCNDTSEYFGAVTNYGHGCMEFEEK